MLTPEHDPPTSRQADAAPTPTETSTPERDPPTSPETEVAPTPVEPQSVALPKNRATRHPFRVYGYRVTHEWVWKYGQDRGLDCPNLSKDSLESAVFEYLILRLPGLQNHFIDDSNTAYGYSHILALANNWNPKTFPRVAKRLPKWKRVLGMEDEPRWHKPTLETVPYRVVR